MTTERDDIEAGDDDADECELCGNAHETRHCDQGLCGKCDQLLDNCDCEQPEEIDAAEWIARKVISS